MSAVLSLQRTNTLRLVAFGLGAVSLGYLVASIQTHRAQENATMAQENTTNAIAALQQSIANTDRCIAAMKGASP